MVLNCPGPIAAVPLATAVTVSIVTILVVVSVASALYIWFVRGVDCYHRYLCFVVARACY